MPGELSSESRRSYGALNDPGTYGTTVTQPALFADYYVSQLSHLLENHPAPVVVSPVSLLVTETGPGMSLHPPGSIALVRNRKEAARCFTKGVGGRKASLKIG